MRRLVDAERLHALMRALGGRTDVETTCYLTGGATAVLLGWRDSTIDVDMLFAPENDQLLRAIPELKEELELNDDLSRSRRSRAASRVLRRNRVRALPFSGDRPRLVPGCG